MILIELFIAFFKVGVLSFGGGLAAISLIQDEIVLNKAWISMDEFVNLITIAQMTPGPIGLNLSTFVGTDVGGVSGAIIATAGFVTPSVIILSLLSYMYYKYSSLELMQAILKLLRPVVLSFIAYAGITIFKFMIPDEIFGINYVGLFIFTLTIFFIKKLKIETIKSMLLSGIIGFIVYVLIKFL